LETFKSFDSKLYAVNEESFLDIALELFNFQAVHNPIYEAFIKHLAIPFNSIDSLSKIPFLPISFFKTHTIKTGEWPTQQTFTSSGTTSQIQSVHAIYDVNLYLDHSRRCFEHFFGPLENYHFLALLPSYLERKGSSLIAMMDNFIQRSGSNHSGFYLNDYENLLRKVREIRGDEKKTILWGVSFALLELAEQYEADLSHCFVFETGGMKGRRKEITRQELHEKLKEKLNISYLFSEYGMTELLSQAYSNRDLRFFTPPWMKIICRDLTDPFKKGLLSETGGINVIDFANWRTISFIETEDLGKSYPDGSFEVLGRLDNSDVRGCNLLLD
jgi:hypothetical protein